MTSPQPSVGRVVHYVSYGTPGGEYTSQCRAAIIAGVPAPDDNDAQDFIEGVPAANRADLVVLNPTGLFFNRCQQDEAEKRGGTWHWPERV